MQLQPITGVCAQYGVSTRTLRYYEQLGLLQSGRMPGYAYRAYSEEALARLRQILLLRKLRVPLRQIGAILQDNDMQLALGILQENLAAIEKEMAALATLRDVLAAFVARLNRHMPKKLALDALADEELLAMADALSRTMLTRKTERSVKDLEKAEKTLGRLTDVRIVYLPPCAVAASHVLGPEPEPKAIQQLEDFIEAAELPRQKPDFRILGFNNPFSPTPPAVGYEVWATIPQDMPVPPPLVKKQFHGGLYAAHMIPMGAFHEWAWLGEWLQASDEYEGDFAPRYTPGDPDNPPDPAMEEQLNAVNHLRGKDIQNLQLDLLLPVKPKNKKQ